MFLCSAKGGFQKSSSGGDSVEVQVTAFIWKSITNSHSATSRWCQILLS